MVETDQQRRDRERQEDLEKLKGLRPIDDDFMRCIFRDNIPLAQLVLRIVTGKMDLVVDDLTTQKDMKRLVGARSIMLDAYASDSESKKYDLEVQRADRGADKHRARYHSILKILMQDSILMNCLRHIPFLSLKMMCLVTVSHSIG